MRVRVPALAASVVVAAVCARGYVRTVTKTGIPLFRTDVSHIQVLVNGSVRAGQANAEGGVFIAPNSDPLQALRNAQATWNGAAGSPIMFNGVQTTTASNDPNDGQFVITAQDTPEIRSLVGSFLAFTISVYAADGSILDSDLLINPKAASGSGLQVFGTNQAAGTIDFQSVFTHELGHALGAHHTPVVGATMFYGQAVCGEFVRSSECSAHQALAADDLAFAASAYPGSGGSPRGSIAGQVMLPNGMSPLGALVIAADPSTGVIIGGIASLDDGSYRLDGIPVGSYQVYAEPADGPFSPDQVSFLPNIGRMSTAFHTGFAGGNKSPSSIAVTAGGTVRADITVLASGTADIATLGLGSAGGADWASTGGLLQAIPSGQAVDVLLWGKGLDASVTADQVRLIGPGLTLRAGTLKLAPDAVAFGFTPLRFTLEMAARATPTLATIAVVKDADAAAYSGGLLLLPPAASLAITSVSPTNAAVGAAAFTLTVDGANFTPSSTVVWNGTERPTTFVSTTRLIVAISAGDLVRAGTVQVVAFDFASLRFSNGVPFAVTAGGGGGPPAISAVQNGASFLPGIAAGSWVTIRGSNLANTNPGRTWRADEVAGGKLPTALDGVSVTINGRTAYVYFISPGQINVLAPPDSTVGTVNVVVTNNGASSPPAPAVLQIFSPALFEYGNVSGIATRYPDNALIGNPAVTPGTVAAKAGDVLILWGTGFGPTNPAAPVGSAVTAALVVTALPSVSVAGAAVTVLAGALSPGSVGLYQIAVQLPAGLRAAGDVDIVLSVGGVSSPPGVKIFVAQN